MESLFKKSLNLVWYLMPKGYSLSLQIVLWGSISNVVPHGEGACAHSTSVLSLCVIFLSFATRSSCRPLALIRLPRPILKEVRSVLGRCRGLYPYPPIYKPSMAAPVSSVITGLVADKRPCGRYRLFWSCYSLQFQWLHRGSFASRKNFFKLLYKI